MATSELATKLDPPVDLSRDHFLGDPGAEITLVEYGSYACKYCHAAHEVIATLRDRFGNRLNYVFRQLPIKGSEYARPAADLAEFAARTGTRFWQVHNALMNRGPDFEEGDLQSIAKDFNLRIDDEEKADAVEAARARVDADRRSARQSGARMTPTFFINGRRYEGAWDETALTEAMIGSLGHRIHGATLNFVRWGPSAGLLLLLFSVLAVILMNSPAADLFAALWEKRVGIQFGDGGFFLTLRDWIDHALLSIFFLVVGLEIKREFTVGHLATKRAAALPVAAAVGGMIVPAVIFYLITNGTSMSHGWGVPIATDTAFAIAIIVLLGERVPVELRVFLTAAVIVDDLAAIGIVALFYSSAIHFEFIAASVAVTIAMAALNKWNVYRPLPYVIAGVLLWVCIHESGLHSTLAGVIIAIFTPTRPPGNLRALLAQAENIVLYETKRSGEEVLRHGPSEPSIRALDTLFGRIESPADKLLRNLEPWSSYFVLPLFALANAGVTFSSEVMTGHASTFAAIMLGLVIGKPVGIISAAGLAVLTGLAIKPSSYSWRQLAGAGALGGIGFTMSLFIAAQAFPVPADFAAAKVAIFAASLLAGTIGIMILLPKSSSQMEESIPPAEFVAGSEA